MLTEENLYRFFCGELEKEMCVKLGEKRLKVKSEMIKKSLNFFFNVKLRVLHVSLKLKKLRYRIGVKTVWNERIRNLPDKKKQILKNKKLFCFCGGIVFRFVKSFCLKFREFYPDFTLIIHKIYEIIIECF